MCVRPKKEKIAYSAGVVSKSNVWSFFKTSAGLTNFITQGVSKNEKYCRRQAIAKRVIIFPMHYLTLLGECEYYLSYNDSTAKGS